MEVTLSGRHFKFISVLLNELKCDINNVSFSSITSDMAHDTNGPCIIKNWQNYPCFLHMDFNK